jgi:DNA transformation protein and related proteins
MTNQQNQLTNLPNIGKVLAEKLNEVGISSPQELKDFGTEQAFIRLSAIDNSVCINMLYAIEGAIQEIRWHQLPYDRKKELLNFFNVCKLN